MKYWLIGIIAIALCVGLLFLLFYNTEIFAFVFFGLIAIVGAYPLGKKIAENINQEILKNVH